ncbi:MAG: diguanylate cyclase [Silanimonas sp.]
MALRSALRCLALVVLLCSSSAKAELRALDAEAWRELHQPRFESVDAQGAVLDGPVRAITEDVDGLVWTVSGASLWRWDGYRLVKARLRVASRAGGEESPVLQTVTADADGELWVGGARGLFRVDRQWPSEPALVPVPLGGEPPSIQFIAFPRQVDAGIRAFLGTVNAVLVLPRDGRARAVPIPDAGPNRLHALHVDTAGRVWGGTTQGLFRLVEPDGDARWIAQPLPVAASRIAALDSEASGRLWIGTAHDGLFSLDAADEVRAWPWPPGTSPAPRIFALARVRDGELWAGQFGHGVWSLDIDSGHWRVLRHERGRRGSLEDDNIWSLYADSRRLAWVGTGSGLQFGAPGQRRMLNLPLAPDRPTDPARLRVHGLAASPGGVWMGTNAGRMRHVGPSAPGATEARLEALWGRGDVAAGAMELVASMGQGRWVLGSDWRTALAEPGRDRIVPLQPAARGSATYTSAVVAWEGAWWLSGPDGLWRVPLGPNGEPNVEDARNLLADASGERRVSSLLATPRTLWIGTWSGLARLDAGASSVHHLSVPGLDSHFVAAMVADASGRLWVGTSAGGIFHAPARDVSTPSSWSVIDESNGLPGNSVSALLADPAGHIWASTSRGLVDIDPRQFRLRAYRPEQGAAAAPYVRRSALALPGGELLFGGTDALTVVLPDDGSASASRSLPPLVLTDISSGEHEPALLFDSAGSAGAARLRVPPGVSRVGLEFAAPVFLGAQNLRYRHRLYGWDDDWTEVDSEHRVASYTRLAPGTYRFDVEVAEANGPWRDGGLALDVQVIPAWHQHRGFHVALVLAVLAIVAGAVHWRARLLRARARQLAYMVDVRTADLATANAELAKAHRAVEEASLTDPLTGLHNRRFLWRHIDADVALALRSRFGAEPEPRDPSDLLFFLVDVDHFKRINDQHGHAVGDLVLVEMGRRLRAVFRESDHVVRWGGEEFLGVARGAHRDDGPRVAERIRAAVAGEPFHLPGGQSLAVRCSIGYAALPLVAAHRHAFSWEDTVAIADEALYEAKAAGRDGWAGFEESSGPIDPQDLAALRQRSLNAARVPSLRLHRSPR